VKPRVKRGIVAVGRALIASGYPRHGTRYLCLVLDDTQDPPVMDVLHCSPNDVSTLREEALDLLDAAAEAIRDGGVRPQSEGMS
jgi:hypothetical protein